MNKGTTGHLRRLRLCLTRAEVTFDNHLVLLLIPSSDDQVVFCADEPQELLEPVNQGRNGGENEHFWAERCFLWRLTNRLYGLSGWWSPSGPLSVFSGFFSLLTSWPWMIQKQNERHLKMQINTNIFILIVHQDHSYLICSFNGFKFFPFS